MPGRSCNDIRNIALIGHSGVGKTLLLESLLLKSGAIDSMGSIARGSTVSDFDPMEKEKQHSLDSAIVSTHHLDTCINFIDTPGYPDFRGTTLTATAAVETGMIVINAQHGIEFNTIRMMERAKRRELSRVIVINKIDAPDCDLEKLVRDIRTTFGDVCLPINLPANNATEVVDCFFGLDGDSDIFSVSSAHTEITDQVVEMDEELMEEYLETGKVDPERLHDAFEAALRGSHLIPICFTSAQNGTGVEKLLDLCAKLLPNPTEGNPPPFQKGSGEDIEPVSPTHGPDDHIIAHVFKITNDPYIGKLSIFRIYQGTIRPDTQLYIGDGKKSFKVNHLFKIQGKKHVEVKEGKPGDICAVAKIDEIHYDAVLHDSHEEDNFHLRPVTFPQSMFGLAIEPRTRGDEQKLSSALMKLSEEDPCFVVEHNKELNETIIHGLGDLHLQIMLEKMKKRFSTEVTSHPPRIAYRETIGAAAKGHYRHKKQTGGAGQFGEVYLRVKPLPRGEGFAFISKVVGGAIPTNLIPAVEKGVRQTLADGAIAGYPLQDIEVTVYDGKHHPVDSKEIAFFTAGKKAFLAAIGNARPVVLEPVVDIHVTTPDQHMGDITGGLASKRARINGSNAAPGGMVVVDAKVPLSELTDYQTEIKSVTAGKGQYVMQFSHYDAVPARIQKALVESHKPAHED